ncbi:MAG: two-component regulator propeller domain-containing protein [Crocinitomix sp.]|nr:two-component regulator propeller domain-containing protein [Crocinitomix sp.]
MRKLITILLVFVGMNAFTQQFHFKQYSLEEGLSRSGVYDILQDRNGFLWVATEGGGLCKFDGKTFQTYTRFNGLASEKIRIIFQDKSGVIWLGTTNGLTYFNGEDFVSLTESDGIANNYIRSIAQDHEGNIWVGSNEGISIIDSDEKGVSHKLKLNFSLPHKKVRSLQTQGNIMWIGTDAGLCKYNDGKITEFNSSNGLSNDIILTLFVDSNNELWVGTENGLNKINNDTIQHWSNENGLINNRVRSIAEDYKGNIWIGTSDGISVFNGYTFLNLTSKNGLSNERIRCVSTDNFNNIWVGTYFGGIMRFNHQDFVAYTTAEGLVSNQIHCITEDEKGDIIVGTYDGVSKLKIYNEKLLRSKTVTTEQGLTDNDVRAILKDENDCYWYGTEKGITLIQSNKVTYLDEKMGLKNSEITVIKKIDDIYWIGTNDGVAKIKTDNYKAFTIDFYQQDNGLSGSVVSQIAADSQNNVWISFLDGTFSYFAENRFINPIMDESIQEITSFTIDADDKFWIGTNGNGLFYGNYDTLEHTLNSDKLSTLHDLSSHYIFSILLDDDLIWVGHENGLDLITAKTDSTFDIQTYGPERGFFGLQNNQNASFKDSDGNLWFGTVNGLFCLKNNVLEQFTEGKPSVNYIKSVKINGKYLDWSNSNDWCSGSEGVFALPVNLRLPYDENNISFDFIGLNFISPKNVKYSWMLEGFDNDWKTVTKNDFAAYTNLDPGNYSFLLRSSNEHGRIVGDPIRFDFKIEKPWWSTWLVRIIAALLVVGFISFLISLRTRQLRLKQSALEETIEERTTEIRRQKEELEYKNHEITDSILYSRRIQYSILPGTEKLNSALETYFVFYKPKDIVSGDFYWAELSPNKKDLTFVAVADCTGHGVPGAMVSLVVTRALNSAVRENELTKPSDILDQTNDIVLEAFTDAESGTIIKDGMDIALLSLDKSTPKISFQFAGAHNPLWIIREKTNGNLIVNDTEIEPNIDLGDYNLFEIKGDKQPIGYFENKVPFKNHAGELVKGDRIYLISDGYADQFGGPKGKKFKYKALKNLLLSQQNITIEAQHEELKKAFFDWMGDLEQLDDVCLMGIEI